MDGCGYYSQYGVGSFILFPTFTIEVDDSSDNLVSFQAVGDYKEPKQLAARPAHIVPPEDDDDADALSQIKITIPDPKARPFPQDTTPPHNHPPTTPYPKSQVPDEDNLVISDSDFVASAQQPLTKRMLTHIHDDPSSLPEVPPEYTPGPTC
jgi:hypothetical protein